MPKTRNVKMSKATKRDDSLQSRVLHPYPPVTIQPRRKMISRAVAAAQFKLAEEAGPYYLQAWKLGEKNAFLDRFYAVWFTLWPEIPKDKDDLEAVADRRRTTRRREPATIHWNDFCKETLRRHEEEMNAEKEKAKQQEEVKERQVQAQSYLAAQRKKVSQLQKDAEMLKHAQLLAEFATESQQRMIVRLQLPNIKPAFRHCSGKLIPSPLRNLYTSDTTASDPASDETDGAALQDAPSDCAPLQI
ncbi:hypothetical protein JR316_0007622 [Psilocybe cubensis]|uniref:Uncharacterized protein n=2 Tax=Psilocybe cubensis TaxID=181762 RepID=A0ACB8GUD6_PSICU|nr:hypothetical protein JR316_0007622 [Psilocybe cubensis]KAH9479047.1 hypothetical protein JR316_0007622 [Psilocybe cubensis]